MKMYWLFSLFLLLLFLGCSDRDVDAEKRRKYVADWYAKYPADEAKLAESFFDALSDHHNSTKAEILYEEWLQITTNRPNVRETTPLRQIIYDALWSAKTANRLGADAVAYYLGEAKKQLGDKPKIILCGSDISYYLLPQLHSEHAILTKHRIHEPWYVECANAINLNSVKLFTPSELKKETDRFVRAFIEAEQENPAYTDKETITVSMEKAVVQLNRMLIRALIEKNRDRFDIYLEERFLSTEFYTNALPQGFF